MKTKAINRFRPNCRRPSASITYVQTCNGTPMNTIEIRQNAINQAPHPLSKWDTTAPSVLSVVPTHVCHSVHPCHNACRTAHTQRLQKQTWRFSSLIHSNLIFIAFLLLVILSADPAPTFIFANTSFNCILVACYSIPPSTLPTLEFVYSSSFFVILTASSFVSTFVASFLRILPLWQLPSSLLHPLPPQLAQQLLLQRNFEPSSSKSVSLLELIKLFSLVTSAHTRAAIPASTSCSTPIRRTIHFPTEIHHCVSFRIPNVLR